MTLTDEMRADGWIEHDGGPCPVPLDSRVEIQLTAGDTTTGEAQWFFWGAMPPGGRDAQIIAYKPEPSHD